MIKTTNFEVSKKLAEIGFKKEAEYFFYKTKPYWFKETWSWQYVWHYATEGWDDANNDSNFLPSYDLETLLEFAFNNIENFRICDHGVSVAEFLSDYDNWHGHYKIVDNLDISIGFKETKISYADAIGKLIILLHEKNLIKF